MEFQYRQTVFLSCSIQILLQLGERRQVVEIQDFKTLKDLIYYTQVHYDVSTNSRIYFQKYCSDWNDYVEISNLDDLLNKDKVVAVVIHVDDVDVTSFDSTKKVYKLYSFSTDLIFCF